MQSGAKNPPWARSNVNANMTGMNPQIMDPNAMGMGQQGMMSYQQSQPVFNPNIMQAQGGMSMPMGGQMPMNQMTQGQMYPGNVVAYPTPRAMNPGMYQNNQGNQNQPSTNEQRVFTGTVTKTHNDFGFVDQDVFYQTSVCAKGVIPKINDRVLVEATYNPNMPFKWNATRVQVLPKSGPNHNNHNKGGPGPQSKSNNYNAVPPPLGGKKQQMQQQNNRNRLERDDRPPRHIRDERPMKRSRSRSLSRSRERRSSRERSRRESSPPRKRPAAHQPSPVQYVVRVPRIPLDVSSLDVPSLTQRYSNMYIPSDFFSAKVRWGETFPPQNPFSLNNTCGYHIMPKDIGNPMQNDAILEPPDADYRFSAKVMLIGLPTLESLYQKCGLTKSDDKDKRNNKNPQHPTRLIKFLVGQKGKGGENFAIGGPWSPSLDGENPESDLSVLVKTAIRTCKALTGIDLTPCTQWYRMVEFYYWRESSGKSRLETVVLFLPDVWSAQPTRIDWPDVQERYRTACEAALRKLQAAAAGEPEEETPVVPARSSPAAAAAADSSQIAQQSLEDSTITIEENEDDDKDKPEPTHYSKLELKLLKVDQLRQELRARNQSCKGLRPQLLSRLTKILKAEEDAEQKKDGNDEEAESVKEEAEKKDPEKKQDEVMEVADDDEKEPESQENKEEPKVEAHIEIKDDEQDDKKDSKSVEEKPKPKKEKTEKEIEEDKKKLEKEKQFLKSHYEIPNQPHLIVHPNTAAKGGKFNCTSATLSLLLDYRVSDNKEHSFELFVFAELFNEMMMRDFGFYVYKTLYTLPEKVDEVKEKSAEKKKEEDGKEDKKDDKKEDKKDDKKDEKKEDKKEEKKEEKRDERSSRRRERKDSHSDEERSASQPRKSCGVELPPDPYLLLSLVYFDTSRSGYIVKKDLQILFMSLGLKLSRSQIKSMLEKVCVKENFSYKSLVQAIKDLASGTPESMQDLPLDTNVVSVDEVPVHIAELEATIAAGNRELLPVFKSAGGDEDGDNKSSGQAADVSANGMVMYKSRLVDVASTLTALSRSETQRSKLEVALAEARAVARTMRAAHLATQAASKNSQAQLSEINQQLATAKNRIVSLTASSKIFHSALKHIQTKVEAVVNIKYEDDDVVEVVNGPAKQGNAALKSETKKEETEEKTKKQEMKKEEMKKEETKKEETKKEETKKEETTDTETKKEPATDLIQTENMEIVDEKE